MSEQGESQFGLGLSPEFDPRPEAAERVVLDTECEGHFKNGIKILPAFRMLEQFTDQMVNQKNKIPSSFHMTIGDMLPIGVNYTRRYDDAGPAHRLTLQRRPQHEMVIQGEPIDLPLVDQSELFGSADTPPVDLNRVLLNSDQIQALIPQGPNIQFIDAVIKPQPYQPKVLAEAIHTVTPEDYQRLGDSDYVYFNRSRLLEGLGQLAYIYFQKHITTSQPMIPYFESVKGHFNIDYHPHIEEMIHYQLIHFEADITGRENTGSGIISGLVLSGNRILANFTATVGAMEQRRLEKIVDLARRQSLKTTQPEQL